MRRKVLVPLWQLIGGAILAAWAALDRLLLPSVRWFFRQRANRAIEEVSTRLKIKLPVFKLTKRRVLIDRLVYDPQVMQAVEDHCLDTGEPHAVALEKVERYAHEIVPSFNAYVYFRLGTWLSKSVARLLYRVRLGATNTQSINALDPNASIVFVMNHRSNMDYILLAHLVSDQVALSYAVGEWARIWPIQQLIQLMGAFFVRRGSGNTLYRRVLERYVQMATEHGVVQAMYPEGGLSRDGALREPKIGLLDYMLRQFDPQAERDLVFLPIGVNYDRVLEDRTLLRSLDENAPKVSRWQAFKRTLGFVWHNVRLSMRGGWHRFGYAVVHFGVPISAREYTQQNEINWKTLERSERIALVQQFANTLMQSVAASVPTVPVALVSTVFMHHPEQALSHLELKAKTQAVIEQLRERNAPVYIPRQSDEYTIDFGLQSLVLRRMITEINGLYRVNPKNELLLRYYANSIGHYLG